MKSEPEVLRMLSERLEPDMEDVVEVPLLLPVWQMSALEKAAYHRGVTAAEMVRELLRTYFRDMEASA